VFNYEGVFMKKISIVFLIFLLIGSSFLFASTKWKHEVTSQRILNIDGLDCNDECGDVSTYKIISIDTFKALYATRDKRMKKVGFKNLKISGYEKDAVQLENDEYQWLYAVTFYEEDMEELLNHKNGKVNVYGHVREDTRYGWGIIIDVVEFL